MKKTTSKKTAKAPVKKAATTKASTTNKELDKMIARVAQAKKDKEKSVVVFTTKKKDHKAKTQVSGFGVSDLKPKLYEAYKHMLCEYDVTTRLVSLSDMSVEWIVKLG
jgi:hypothetical protein